MDINEISNELILTNINLFDIKKFNIKKVHGDLSAKFAQCPKRLEYSKALENIKKHRNATTTKITINQYQSAPELANTNFSTINNNTSRSWTKTPINSTFSTQQSHFRTFDNKNTENDLFSIAELMMIFKEILTKLSNCHTKADQFEAIAEIAFTHLYVK